MDLKLMKRLKPYIAIVLLQFGYSGMAIIAKSALNNGMSHYTFSVYRNIVASIVVAPFALIFERKTRPRMTFSVMYKIIILALLEPVIDQNLYYTAMKYTSPTFTTAMLNVLPAITFVLAWILRLENVDIKRAHSQAKIVGTLVTIGGAMVMTLVAGPVLGMPWTEKPHQNSARIEKPQENSVKGALMVTTGCFCWSMFYIIQAITLKSYGSGLSLTCLVCFVGALQGTVLTLAVEWRNAAIWALQWDSTLLCIIYGGLISSGVGYYVSGVVIKEKGPVFVTTFNPLTMVIVAMMSSFILSEQLNVGKVTGALIIVVGLYLVIWGKSKDHKVIGEAIKDQQQFSRNGNPSPSSDNVDFQDHQPKSFGDDNVV